MVYKKCWLNYKTLDWYTDTLYTFEYMYCLLTFILGGALDTLSNLLSPCQVWVWTRQGPCCFHGQNNIACVVQYWLVPGTDLNVVNKRIIWVLFQNPSCLHTDVTEEVVIIVWKSFVFDLCIKLSTHWII